MIGFRKLELLRSSLHGRLMFMRGANHMTANMASAGYIMGKLRFANSLPCDVFVGTASGTSGNAVRQPLLQIMT